MAHASCLCGAVTWTIEGPFEWMSHCHCSRCRKLHGTAFATYLAGPAASYSRQGDDNVTKWESSPGFSRCFCRNCGSVVPGDVNQGRAYSPVGNMHDDPGTRPIAHIFVGSKAPWYEITDPVMQFDTYPQGIDAPVLADQAPVDPAGSGTRGSCACRGVAYLVTAAPIRSFNCHCSRCRRGRSAAHGSNFFTQIDGVRFTRGEDLLVTYKVPEAQHFSQTFCRVCGAKMPRLDPNRGIAIVPMGGLDDDPGIRPQAHIFTGSKAPWFEITDSLPRFEAAPPNPPSRD